MLWLHILGASIWVGSIIFLGIVLAPLSKRLIPDDARRSEFMADIGRRFNILGWSSMAVLVVTGLYNVNRFTGGFTRLGALLPTTYGLTLLAKAILVILMITITFYHSFILGPRIRTLTTKLGASATTRPLESTNLLRLQRTSGVLMSTLAVLAVCTLFLAALLRTLT